MGYMECVDREQDEAWRSRWAGRLRLRRKVASVTCDHIVGGVPSGDGSDGEAVLDGTGDVAWAERQDTVYRMTRDCQVISLTVTPAALLLTGGYKIEARGLVEWWDNIRVAAD